MESALYGYYHIETDGISNSMDTQKVEGFLETQGCLLEDGPGSFRHKEVFLTLRLMNVQNKESWNSNNYNESTTNYIAIVTSKFPPPVVKQFFKEFEEFVGWPILEETDEVGPFYHGTKASLTAGDFLEPGYPSNFGEHKKAKYVYFTATLDAAVWGAELALGQEPGRIYCVEPTGSIEDDPNLTDKKFPGNPTRSYRSNKPLLVLGEVLDWKGHTGEELRSMRVSIEGLKQSGLDEILE